MYKMIKKTFGKISPFLKKIEDDNIFAISGQSAFFMLLALIPFAMFAVSILQNLNIPVSKFDRFFRIIFNEQVSAQISNFLGSVNNGSVSVSLITMLFTLWSAAQGVHAITSGLNRIHHTYENRNWFMVRFRAMFYTVVLVFILFATAFVIVVGSTIKNIITMNVPDFPKIVAVLYRFRFIIIFVYLVFLFSFIYRNLPNLTQGTRADYKFVYQLPGSLLCAAAWIALSWGISIYVGDFNGFSIYGSLSKVAVMMVWLYFCILFLMFGAEINSYYHIQIKHFIDNKVFKIKKKKH